MVQPQKYGKMWTFYFWFGRPWFIWNMVSQTENVWTFLFLRLLAFRKSMMVVCLWKENHRQMVKWVVLSGCLSDWRKWFRKPFPRQHGPKHTWVQGRSRRSSETKSRVFRGSPTGQKDIDLVIEMGRLAVSDCATFSDFVGSDNENVSENRNGLKTSHQYNGFYQIIPRGHSSEMSFPFRIDGVFHDAFIFLSDTWQWCIETVCE